jgi:CheY-like chemotaxis protein
MRDQINVLIVDDDPLVINLLNIILSKDGYITHTASSGNAALSFLENHHVDILLTDFSMPQMNGVELVREVRKTYPSLITFMITAYAADYIQQYDSEAGIQEVLTKPLNIDRLNTLLSSYINTIY